MPSLFVIGDSISIQYGPYLEAMVRDVFDYARKSGEEEALKDLDIPQGANGGDSSMVLAYLQALCAGGGFAPEVLLVNCGLHDIKTPPDSVTRQVPLDDYEKNLREIAALSMALAGTFVWVRTTDVVDEIHNSRAHFRRYAADAEAYNSVADRVMREAGVAVADLYSFTRNLGPAEERFCDHVHFAEPVRMQQAAFLAGFVGGVRAEK